MKTTLFLICALAGVTAVIGLTAGCNRKPKDHKAQVSYSIGASFGRSLKAQNLDLDKSALAKGVQHGFEGKELLLNDQEMQGALAKLSEMRQTEMRETAEKNKSKAEEFLTKNKEAEGVTTTTSGLQYKTVSEGSGPSPKPDDVVVVNYKGTLIDGTEFDSSYKRNQPAEFPIRGVIPGWTEGLQLMKKGGKAVFFVPPELGYGAQARQQIPPNAVLIFDVELLDIKAGKGKMHGAPPVVRPKSK
jgi:FKBP-type peptidyl-prolyl cis-trans isomerase